MDSGEIVIRTPKVTHGFSQARRNRGEPNMGNVDELDTRIPIKSRNKVRDRVG
jgi:hypothetical protein